MSRHLALLLTLLGTLGVSNRARAGMPAPVQLTEMTELRLQSISFFLVGFFLSAFLIQRLWNYLGQGLEVSAAIGIRSGAAVRTRAVPTLEPRDPTDDPIKVRVSVVDFDGEVIIAAAGHAEIIAQ